MSFNPDSMSDVVYFVFLVEPITISLLTQTVNSNLIVLSLVIDRFSDPGRQLISIQTISISILVEIPFNFNFISVINLQVTVGSSGNYLNNADFLVNLVIL